MNQPEKKFAFVFEGQGKQFPGMYLDLYNISPEARKIFDTADRFCRRTGWPRITDVCFEADPTKSLLVQPNFHPISVQLAIVTGEVATSAYLHKRGVPDADVNAGQSLGQFAAAIESKFFIYQRILPAIVVRAQVTEHASQIKETANGVIYDIRRKEHDLIGVVKQKLDQSRQEDDDGEVTLFNHRYQVMVGGTRRHIEELINLIRESHPGIRAELFLNAQLSHHRRLTDVQPIFNRVLESIRSGIGATIPLISDATNQVVHTLSDFKREVGSQLKNPLDWNSNMQRLSDMGAMTWVEIGPGKIFGPMAKMASLDVEVLPTPNVEAMEEVIERLARPSKAFSI